MASDCDRLCCILQIQIELDSQRRKALLDAPQPVDEELFSWDDADEEQTASPAKRSDSTPTQGESPATTPSAIASNPTETPASTPATTHSASASPRESEESYDLVSEQSSVAGANATSRAGTRSVTPSQSEGVSDKAKGDDSDDSDWE